MAEKAPESKSSKGKDDTKEKRKSSVQIILSPDEETGYGSATHSSDLLSGAEATSESAAFTSEDIEPEAIKVQKSPSFLKKIRRRMSPKKPVRSSESDTKSGKTPEKMKTRSQKKSTPVKQTKEATDEGREDPLIASQSQELVSAECSASPAEKEASGGVTPKKSRSGRSLLSKFISPKKDEKAASHLTVPRTMETRSSKKVTKSPSKSSVSSARSPRRQKASTSSVVSAEGSLTEQPEFGEQEKSIKSSASPAKRRSPWKIGKSKSPGKQQKASTRSESSGTEAHTLATDKSETRRKLKFSHTRSKSPMRSEVSDSSHKLRTSPGEERPHSGMKQSILATYELMSSGVQSIHMSRKGSDCVPLLCPEDRVDTTDSDDTRETAVSKPDDKCLEKENLSESATEKRRSLWRSTKTTQKSGWMHEDLRTSFMSSIDDTTTEMSTVSDSSAAHGGSESRKGYSTSSDTQSEISVFEEVPELVSSVLSLDTAGKSETPVFEEQPESGATGVQRAERPQLRRQKRIKEKSSSDSDEEARSYRAICGSPTKKPAPHRETTDDDGDE